MDARLKRIRGMLRNAATATPADVAAFSRAVEDYRGDLLKQFDELQRGGENAATATKRAKRSPKKR